MNKFEIVEQYNTGSQLEQQLSIRYQEVLDDLRSHARFLAGNPDSLEFYLEVEPVKTLKVISGLLNFSIEKFRSVLVRIPTDSVLSSRMGYDKWYCNWQNEKGLESDPFFRKGVVKLFTEGAIWPSFKASMYQKRLSVKCLTDFANCSDGIVDNALLHALVGTFGAIKGQYAEELIGDMLTENGVSWSKTVPWRRLGINGRGKARLVDACIPSKNPRIFIECMIHDTTGCGQGDKRRAYDGLLTELQKLGKDIKLWLVMDGTGWLRRESDGVPFCELADEVFTWHDFQKARMISLLGDLLKQWGIPPVPVQGTLWD